MLGRIVKLIDDSSSRIENGTLFCDDYTIADTEVLNYLEEQSALENPLPHKTSGKSIGLELSLAHLNFLGFYEDCDAFIFSNKYRCPQSPYYIAELKSFDTDNSGFILSHRAVVRSIEAIATVARHTYTDVDIKNSIIYREDQSLLLVFEYAAKEVHGIGRSIDQLNAVSEILQESESEKKLLHINEIISFLKIQKEPERFAFWLNSFTDFYQQCQDAYQFYLRDFSYNKLKIELDSKALEYTQKIQGVINDAQTKLIAIPTAFVLVFVALDYEDLTAVKNIVTLVSLFVFAFLIQLFLNNQKSILRFIGANIISYKDTFKDGDVKMLSSKFSLVDEELAKQNRRLEIIQAILWGVPVGVIVVWVVLFEVKSMDFAAWTIWFLITVLSTMLSL